ncbi:hypothetical protein CMN24_04320 [Candidatus Saccharibacteria bacterium]|nr:hypothetical protein [Candidatus Saccharibacteria bacterium]
MKQELLKSADASGSVTHKVLVVGLGGQTRKDHIPALMRRKDVKIIGIVDTNQALLDEYHLLIGVPVFTSLVDAIQTGMPDLAIVSVPHFEYSGILRTLAAHKIATLKEKPLAMTYQEAIEIINMYQDSDTYLQICVQRRFSKLYDTTKKLLDSIGRVYSVYVEYTMKLSAEDMASGWRADKKISGGGAALDMGYHSIDLLTYIFGTPDKVYAQLNYHSLDSNYTIDGTMKAMMTYRDGRINANLVVTKIFNQKNEKVRIFGSDGSIYVDERKVTLYDKDGVEMESHSFNFKTEEVDQQLSYFIEKSKKNRFDSRDRNLKDQLNNMLVIDSIYKSHDISQVIKLG